MYPAWIQVEEGLEFIPGPGVVIILGSTDGPSQPNLILVRQITVESNERGGNIKHG